jgi:hypothetical protein
LPPSQLRRDTLALITDIEATGIANTLYWPLADIATYFEYASQL